MEERMKTRRWEEDLDNTVNGLMEIRFVCEDCSSIYQQICNESKSCEFRNDAVNHKLLGYSRDWSNYFAVFSRSLKSFGVGNCVNRSSGVPKSICTVLARFRLAFSEWQARLRRRKSHVACVESIARKTRTKEQRASRRDRSSYLRS